MSGYWVIDAAGDVSRFGSAAYHGGHPSLRAGERVSTISATPTGDGYRLFTNRGRVFPYGGARSFGDMSTVTLNGPIIASVATPDGLGYFLVGSDGGGIFDLSNKPFAGSLASNPPLRRSSASRPSAPDLNTSCDSRAVEREVGTPSVNTCCAKDVYAALR